MKLSEKIYACRKRCGLSQEALAERVGVSRQAVSKWETGDAEPELAKLRLLADAFGVEAGWLLSDESARAAAPAPAAPPAEPPAAASAPADWLNAIPGFIGRMLRRYGWLFGVYLMLTGLGLALIGGMTASLAGSMENNFNSMGNQIGSPNSPTKAITFYDESGRQVDASHLGITDQAAAELFGSSASGGSATPAQTFFNPVVGMGQFLVVIGVILIIGGGILAVVLKKHGAKT